MSSERWTSGHIPAQRRLWTVSEELTSVTYPI
jgi:hypothetical protein